MHNLPTSHKLWFFYNKLFIVFPKLPINVYFCWYFIGFYCHLAWILVLLLQDTPQFYEGLRALRVLIGAW